MDAVAVSELVPVGISGIVLDLGLVIDGSVNDGVPLAVLGFVMDGSVAVTLSLAVLSRFARPPPPRLIENALVEIQSGSVLAFVFTSFSRLTRSSHTCSTRAR